MHVRQSSCYLSYAWYRAIRMSANQNHNALTTSATWGGHIMVACSASINGCILICQHENKCCMNLKEENCGTLWFGPLSLDKRVSWYINLETNVG